MKTVTEKRFGEYYEDDKSVTLRSSSASVGGEARYLSSPIHRQSWSIVWNRLQMGTTATSRTREIDY